MAVICIGALIVGIIVNEHHIRGIRWHILNLSLPWTVDSGWTHVTTDSAFIMFLDEAPTFVDVRAETDFRIDHVQGARSLPFEDDFARSRVPDNLPMNSPIILYHLERDATEPKLIARFLSQRNFSSIYVMHGGYIEWLDKGFPTESGEE